MSVEERAIKKVLPTEEEEEHLRSVVLELKAVLASRIEERGLDARPILVGSVAKGTHLHDAEIDMFVAFSPDTPRAVLEKEGLALGKILDEGVRMYAEHPYTRGRYRGTEVEVVPCYRITHATQRMTAVDRTPLHADYVIGHLRDGQENQVRVLKAFSEGVGVYGAEAKVRGFSGYLCELLVLRYGSFRAVLEAAQGWHPGEVLDLGVSASRAFEEPLVVVDPIDGRRNVASAVSLQQMAVFAHAAKSFLAKPSERFFFPAPRKPWTVAKLRAALKRRGTSLLLVAIPAPDITDDVLYPQIRKAGFAVADLLRREDFVVRDARFDRTPDEIVLAFELRGGSLPRVRRHEGPPFWVKNAGDFRRKWSRPGAAVGPPFLEDGRWIVEVPRGHTTAAALVKDSLADLSLGKNLDARKRGAKVLADPAGVKAAYADLLTDLFDRRFPWER